MACAMVMSLTACGGSKKDDAATADDRGNSSGKTEITWWAFPTFTQENADYAVGTYEQKVIAAFEEENPDISNTLYVPNQLGAILHGAKQDNVKGCRGLGSRKRRMDDRRFCNGITMGAVKGYCKNWTVVFD